MALVAEFRSLGLREGRRNEEECKDDRSKKYDRQQSTSFVLFHFRSPLKR
jgi:hypothetical protein